MLGCSVAGFPKGAPQVMRGHSQASALWGWKCIYCFRGKQFPQGAVPLSSPFPYWPGRTCPGFLHKDQDFFCAMGCSYGCDSCACSSTSSSWKPLLGLSGRNLCPAGWGFTKGRRREGKCHDRPALGFPVAVVVCPSMDMGRDSRSVLRLEGEEEVTVLLEQFSADWQW